MRNALVIGALLLSASAWARPKEAVRADKASDAIELADLDRRATSLDEQIGLRQRMLKRRVRALYKLTQGGALRLLVEAKDMEEVGARLDAAHRVIGRDLHELGALDEELSELARDRSLRAAEATKVAALDDLPSPTKGGLERRRGDLPRPVAGSIVQGLSRTKVAGASPGAASLELPRRTVELATSPGDAVRAIASGTVRWVGPVEGLGQAVIVDHGDHYVTFTARLRSTRVGVGAQVGEGEVLGQAVSGTVAFELSESRTALDPATWLRAPVPRLPASSQGTTSPSGRKEGEAVDGPAHASATVEHPASL